MEHLLLAGSFLGAYAIGSINTSILAGRLAGKGDVRQVGSGNPGATNTLRLLGKGWAVVVLLVDAGRGAGVYLLAACLLPGVWQPFVVTFGVVLGNLFPVFHGFKGGKGVATSLGLYLAISPSAAGLGIAVFGSVALITRYASLASLLLVLSYPGWLALLGYGWGPIGFGLGMLPVVAFSHRANIGRLLRGEEHRFGQKEKTSG
jgi:glycerol-3-phosphate acyltransferase PlsY